MIRQVFKLIILIIISAGFAQYSLAGERVSVFVSIPPQKYFVQQIGGSQVAVRVMVRPGADPHTYEPKPQQMVALSTAKLYFAIGIEFEAARLDKIISANPRIKVIHTEQGIRKIPMAAHRHSRKDIPRAHNGLDPHIWLSPPLVMTQARTILEALKTVDPANRVNYETNYKAFIARLENLDQELRDIFRGRRGLRFMVLHPSWGYFADAYGLKQVPIELEGKKPGPSSLKALIEYARENNIKVIFVQPQFSPESAKLIAKEIGGEVAFVDPLAENWLANLRTVAGKFMAALK